MLKPRSNDVVRAVDYPSSYLCLLLVYAAVIYGLSSLPPLNVNGLNTSLLHVPLYGGLAFCLLKALPEMLPGKSMAWSLQGLTLLAGAAYAALDEWHQSFVPGRDASSGDFVLDLVGIGLTLLFVRR